MGQPVVHFEVIARDIIGYIASQDAVVLDYACGEALSAAKVANAHSFIIKKEKGYETNIGDRGSKLSGGERQRLTIARAVVKNPPI